eukprot:6187406-Pleurochrysis_carterae.AAC.5
MQIGTLKAKIRVGELFEDTCTGAEPPCSYVLMLFSARQHPHCRGRFRTILALAVDDDAAPALMIRRIIYPELVHGRQRQPIPARLSSVLAQNSQKKRSCDIGPSHTPDAHDVVGLASNISREQSVCVRPSVRASTTCTLLAPRAAVLLGCALPRCRPRAMHAVPPGRHLAPSCSRL